MLIYSAMFGSHGRGEAGPNSDTDVFEVLLPSEDELFDASIGLKDLFKTTQHKKGNLDTVTMYLPKFVQQLIRGNFNCMDVMHSKQILVSTKVSDYLQSIDWRSEALRTSLLGYVKSYLVGSQRGVCQTAKDVSQASLRVQQAFHLNDAYRVSYPFTPDISELYQRCRDLPMIEQTHDMRAIITRALVIKL